MAVIVQRVTQEVLEYLQSNFPVARCTQVVLEVITPLGGVPPVTTPLVHLTQEVLEVLFVRSAFFPPDTVNCPDVIYVD